MRLLRVTAAAVLLTLVLAGTASAGVVVADMQVGKTDSPDPVVAGANITYAITVTNLGPDIASNLSLFDPLPAGTTFVSFTSPLAWTSTTPAVGGTGTVTSVTGSMAVGSAVFTLVLQTSSGLANGTVITNVASVSSAGSDLNINNNSSATTTTVTAPAASVPNAAMPEPASGSPLAILGFGALLVALLSATTALVVRRQRI